MQTKFWAVVLEPEISYTQHLRSPLHLTQATMSFRDRLGRHVLTHEVHMTVSQGYVGNYDSTPDVLLCTLGTIQTGETVQHIPLVPLDIKLQAGCQVTFTATGPAHLIGYLEMDEEKGMNSKKVQSLVVHVNNDLLPVTQVSVSK